MLIIFLSKGDIMAKKTIPTSFVRISHRMNDDEKKLFRILFMHAFPELDIKKEHIIHPQDLLKAWNPQASKHDLERAFWNLGATLTYQCNANPLRHSWGSFALFDGWGIKEDGMYRYVYNGELKRLLSYPNVYKQLLQEGLITEISDHLPSISSESLSSYSVAL